MEQMLQLNADFRRTNPDASNTPAIFQGVAADIEVEFCLTEVDPAGLETSGIMRTHIDDLNVSESDCWTTDYIDERIIAPTIWNRDFFLNIYSVISIDRDSGSGCDFFSTLGYAQFPGGPANTDAAVAAFYTFGSTLNPNPLVPSFMGRTLSHEVGHWLNLEHLWGDNNGSCQDDDNIADTPMQFGPTTGCPGFPLYDDCNMSSNGLMFMNYMDYTDDDCMNLFTQGQRAMMRASLFAARNSIITAPCQVEAALSVEGILDLKISAHDSYIQLEWDWFSSKGYADFIIEKGTSPNNLEPIHDILNLKYDPNSFPIYKDTNIDSGTYYYRIKMINENNEIYYSNIVVSNVEQSIQTFTIGPNPSASHISLYRNGVAVNDKIQILDSKGGLIATIDTNSNHPSDISFLDQGIYFIRIQNEENFKLIKWVKL